MRAPGLGVICLVLFACSRAPASQAPAATPSPDEIRRAGNHLVGQPSPYLKQHSHNPVDWYPWAEEAKARAKRENKPIFLSIGYSTCHWCHVMEKESFEDDQVARALNDGFVAIKVDREERPDVDAFFMGAASELGSSTGWPLTLVLTPDLEPFFAATYLPKEKLKGALSAIRASWATGGAEVKERAKQALARLRAEETEPAATTLGAAELEAAMTRLARGRDDEEGGFGSRMKFPNAPLLLAELRFATRTGDAKALAHVDRTLERMAAGGVHDHLAGTFHRYATDRRWHVPHFEKTLYDNAQLASLYLEASRALGRRDYEDVARAVLDDLIAGWQQKDGGLIVGFDADDGGGEGGFYTWTPKELKELLGPEDAGIFAAKFRVTPSGEASLGGRSVLHRVLESSSNRADAEAIARSSAKLVTARLARPRPPVDDKELTAWNGLALMAFADAARALGEPRYRAAAERIGTFLVDSCWSPTTQRLSHGRVGALALGPGFLDDYALAVLGLARLHAATGEARWLVMAEKLLAAMVTGFAIPGKSSFLRADASVREPALAGAPKDEEDGPLPSGGSAAALALMELGALAGDRATFGRGERALRSRAKVLVESPSSSGYALVAADALVFGMREIVIAGAADDEATRALLSAASGAPYDRFVLARVDAAGPSKELSTAFPSLEGKIASGGKPTAYVCTMGACDAPTSDPAVLREKLAKH